MARRKARTKLTYYDRVEAEITRGDDAYHFFKDISDEIADDARPDAPYQSRGPGHAGGEHARQLIQGEVVMGSNGWEGRVGWPRRAYYLLMHEKGWVHKPARPFLRPAVQRRRDV